MGGCLRAMRVMLRGVLRGVLRGILRGVLRGILRGVLRGAAWCCVVLRWCAAYLHVVLRGPTRYYMVLRGDGMLGWWMMDVET